MLFSSHEKEFEIFHVFLPIYKEVERLVSLCKAASPREVLSQMKICGFDSAVLKRPFLVRENSPIPVHPMGHPLMTACHYANLPVARLLLELGADPDMRYNYHAETLREHYAANIQLQECFKGGKCWWKVEYPDAQKQELQGELERCILTGEASEAIWLMMHGVRLPSPAVLTREEFGKLPPPFKELVCRMGLPADRLDEFHDWLKANGNDAEVMDIMKNLMEDNGDKERGIVEKLLLSLDLLRPDKVDAMAAGAFSSPFRIGLLRHFINAYDTCEHQSFIEKSIAALFREILFACMGA